MRSLIVVMLAAVVFVSPASALELVHNGQSGYVIVLPPTPTPPEQTAATELQHYLMAATGATLPVLPHDEGARHAKRILLGGGPELTQAFPKLDVDALGRDAIVLKTQGDTLFLGGDRPRGTLYAVYTFLEDTVGCRWWSATEEFVPRTPLLQVPPLDVNYAPPIACREAYYRGAFDGVFAARMKLNGHSEEIPPEYGNHYRILGWCHTFEQLLPAEEHFDAHPEWYSEVDGKRLKEYSQLCLTNEAARKALTTKALAWIRSDPEAGMISVSQNDWHNRCQCDACRALEAKEGAPSGPLLHFVNAVAEDIEQEFPDVLVCTLAYQYTRKAPKHARPRENVVVRLCSIECDFSQPLATGARNAGFKADIEAWSDIAGKLYIWNYVTNFRNLILPHPNYQTLAPDIRFFVENNTIGLFEQGDAGCSCSDFPELRVWLLSHLMWDPSRDEHALTQEFVEGYYGGGGAPLLRYLALLEQAIGRSGEPLRCYEQSTEQWLTLADLNEATRLFTEAEAATANDTVLLNRVQRARMPIDHVWLNRYHALKDEAEAQGLPFLGPEDAPAFAKAFVKRAERFDVGWYREAQPFSDYAPVLLNRMRAPGPPPEALRQADPNTYVSVQDNQFSLHGMGAWVTLVEDAAASDGMAARMPGTYSQWAVQLPVTKRIADLGRVRCFAELRCENAGSEGTVVRLGIWDNEAGASVTEKAISANDVKDNGYQTVDLGTWDLDRKMYFWVAPDITLPDDGAVFVDRVYCVQE